LETATNTTLIESLSLEKEMSAAIRLLRPGEQIPLNTEDIIRSCVHDKIGFILSRNVKVFSCRDARSNRSRLGHIGIPLYDELKSIVFKGKTDSGKNIVVATHCRGHMSISINALMEVCGLIHPPEVIDEDELAFLFGMKYGTVTPFIMNCRFSNTILNAFDKSLFSPIAKCPGTMMTNAGDHTWGIEFDPIQLIQATKNKIIADIANPDHELNSHELPSCVNPRPIGIITGNGPESGIALWEGINRHIAKRLGEHFLGDISLPNVSIASLRTMGLSMELDKRNTSIWHNLSEGIRRIDDQGIEILSLACHTTHHYTDKIRELFEKDSKKFVSMAEVVVNHLRRQNISEIAILGIDYVTDVHSADSYSAYSKLVEGINVCVLPLGIQNRFSLLGYEVKRLNDRHRTFMKFMSLIRELQKDIKAPNILLALTELSILYENQYKQKENNNINIINALDIYANAIAEESMAIKDEKINPRKEAVEWTKAER